MRKIAAAAIAASAALALTLSGAASAGTSPSWLHIAPGPSYHGHPCVIVGGGDQGTTARVCKDGKAWIS